MKHVHPIIEAIKQHIKTIYKDKVIVSKQLYDSIITISIKHTNIEAITIHLNVTTINYAIYSINKTIYKSIELTDPELLDKIIQDLK